MVNLGFGSNLASLIVYLEIGIAAAWSNAAGATLPVQFRFRVVFVFFEIGSVDGGGLPLLGGDGADVCTGNLVTIYCHSVIQMKLYLLDTEFVKTFMLVSDLGPALRAPDLGWRI